AEDGIRDYKVTGVQTCALPILQSLVPARGDLVLRIPGAYRPTLRPMSLEGEVDSLERALQEAPRNLGETETLLLAISPSAALDRSEERRVGKECRCRGSPAS